ncbi:WD40 repeat-like protein [Hypoxylon trugodes]|uniref:WD40 repeat-like protein n=1 Tax=Hypoxylon trugodes TaxID=326681 RepID=UPI00219CF8B1|nr:WD40 repeat-like protein [Hypoxylon trugodes]KAI1388913.1 WD40 repeat-like protein [Hypoxylon trugodes]
MDLSIDVLGWIVEWVYHWPLPVDKFQGLQRAKSHYLLSFTILKTTTQNTTYPEPANATARIDTHNHDPTALCSLLFAIMKEYLDSDRVNFLIWRYLIEGNYRETAVKFQKEWHVKEPHRQLDFAQHVKSHALVNVINKGLLYSSLEREHAQSQQQLQQQQVPRDAATPTALAELGIFGPLLAHPPLHQQLLEQRQADEMDQDDDAETDTVAAAAATTTSGGGDAENNRKRQIDRQQQAPLLNGSPAKRPRLSNGYENGVDAATTPMELDGQNHHGDNHAYPSPQEGEQAPTPIPRTDGPEQGTQVEKVEELTTETTFIPLGFGVDDAPTSSPTTALARINGESAPVLLHCQWHPRDPTILAAAGTDALARIWNISRGATTDLASNGHVNGVAPNFHTLVEDDIQPRANITAMAWNTDGSAIAIATDSDSKARINLWGPEGAHLQRFEVPEPPVYKLRWNPSGAAILGIAPDNGGALITVYHAPTSNSMTYYLPRHDLDAEPLDVAWTSESEFLLCGGDLLVALKCADGEIAEVKKFETRDGDILTQVQFDSRTSLAATCGDKGYVDIWDTSGRRREIKAHVDAVTKLAWQPLEQQPSGDERLLASGGEDGAIFVWNALAPDSKAKCSMTMGPAIVALAFTPDGAFIAGATNERILIWKVGDCSIPRASWSRGPHPGWLSPRANAESDEEDEHCLGWDATGHKLAYGVNNRLAIINFR